MKTPKRPDASPVILAFEASTNQLSVAVYADGMARAMKMAEAAFGQAASLVPLAVSALAEADIDFAMVSHVAAGRGPGSFTGLRVSLAAAKGVCLAHDLPGLGVSGLEALAYSCGDEDGDLPILCLVDTRRGNVYAQFFAANMTPQSDIFEAQMAQLPLLVPPALGQEAILLAGNGRQAAAAAFIGAGRQVRLASGRMISADMISVDAADQGVGGISVNAGMIARLAAHHLARGNISPLTPLYLADPRLGPKKKASV
ncbi:tRNA (adenosine(37)-N6)-threonylcarbamoyltransferase complex dimerization subunit type 1 TsaB [Alphaproteobacteria bacterium]|nr:tRNA (adenosine(37)-N6)-threonylcarbamoyltransferase complex dimerization subunit type 1 TsaB [Alphaproteobacteria bacterium]